jgi:hypothetical protein
VGQSSHTLTRPHQRRSFVTWVSVSALGGTRTPNLLIRSQMLYPLSYERLCPDSLWHSAIRRVPR